MAAGGRVAAHLAGLGRALPEAVTPLGSYVSALVVGDTLHLSGHGPLRVGGKPKFVGHVGAEFGEAEAGEILVGAALNALASAERELGDLDRIVTVSEAHAIVACASPDVDLEAVAAPAFGLLADLFGPLGSRRITRVGSLPNGVPSLFEFVAGVTAGPAEEVHSR